MKNSNAKLLDVGCYVGHDLRALHFDGVPQASLHGLDLLDYADLGAELFNDAERFSIRGRFAIGDILDSSTESESSRLFDGKMDIVWCALVIHLFPWDKQVSACKRLVQYTAGPGSMILACQVGKKDIFGNFALHKVTDGKFKGTEPFGHSVETLRRLWIQAGEEAGVKLSVDTRWVEYEDYGLEPKRSKWLGQEMGVLECTVLLL